MVIYYKKIDPRAFAPEKQYMLDAGWDIHAISREMDVDTGSIIYRTGLAFAVPRGMWLDARARSSVFKTGMMLCNGVGTIDAGYRGEVCFHFYKVFMHNPSFFRPYNVGDRIGQLIPMPVRTDDVTFEETDVLPKSEDDRNGGFGSTGV